MKTFTMTFLIVITILVAGLYTLEFLPVIPKTRENVIERTIVIREKQHYYERMTINQRIKELQKIGGYSEVLEHYSEIAQDSDIALMILNVAIVHDVPVNLAFALCRQESNFKVSALNENKTKEGKVWSRDYGLFQLNTKRFGSYYKKHGKEWVMEPQNNIFLGIKELRDLYERHGGWDIAIIKYNGGFERGADMHLVNVYQYEREYDRGFNEKF
jgi:soluble lytic murein transglycosylase-like protein